MLDPQVLKNLLELAKSCKILNHTNLNVINPSKSLEQDLVNNKNPQHEIKHSEIQEAQLPVIVPKEKWVYVNPDKVYKVAIGEFSRPNSFFVQLADDNHKWNRFVKKLDDHMPNKIPLENPKPGVICLMNTEAGLERVKLLDVFDEKCTICNLDNGYTANADMNVLYEISSDLMTYIPFQVNKISLRTNNCNIYIYKYFRQFIANSQVSNHTTQNIGRQKLLMRCLIE